MYDLIRTRLTDDRRLKLLITALPNFPAQTLGVNIVFSCLKEH